MFDEHLPDQHPDVKFGKIGVLLINLGTPDGTDVQSMRRYLKEFLSDRRVIEVNPVLWWFILNGIILNTRPAKSGKAYAKIWNTEQNESPLRTITRDQCERVAEKLVAKDSRIVVDWAMRYGKPSIAEGIDRLSQQGCERILLFALYPQYSAATMASVFDKAFDALGKMRWQPAIRTNPPYHDAPEYVTALASSLKTHLASLDWTPDVVIASYHGLPQSYFDKGDPYHCHCAKTTRLLRQELGWDDERLRMTFQSRFGKEEWLKPYTDKTLEELARSGTRNVAVITPGFAADCVETLEEIAIEAGETFREHGGEKFTVVPCLNASPDGIDMLERLVWNELGGWIAGSGR